MEGTGAPTRADNSHELTRDSIQAEEALSSNETPVGCVFVYDGTIIGSGKNATNASLSVHMCRNHI